jgi:hypothetical protein
MKKVPAVGKEEPGLTHSTPAADTEFLLGGSLPALSSPTFGRDVRDS